MDEPINESNEYIVRIKELENENNELKRRVDLLERLDFKWAGNLRRWSRTP